MALLISNGNLLCKVRQGPRLGEERIQAGRGAAGAAGAAGECREQEQGLSHQKLSRLEYFFLNCFLIAKFSSSVTFGLAHCGAQ